MCYPAPNWPFGKGCGYGFFSSSQNQSHLVAPSRRLEVTSDPDDNIFVECADAARAGFLVTGNRKHFPPFCKSTKVITPPKFVSLVAPHLIR